MPAGEQIARQPHAGSERLQIGLRLQEVEPDRRRRQRIGPLDHTLPRLSGRRCTALRVNPGNGCAVAPLVPREVLYGNEN